MGLIGSILGAGGAARQVGEAVGGVAEVFAGNRAERDADASRQALRRGRPVRRRVRPPGRRRFDGFVNGLNRLPRPLLALGTLGLFAYAMAAPGRLLDRMQGLALVPEPLWWLLGAIVSFYFGARELHHQRSAAPPRRRRLRRRRADARPASRRAARPADPDHNAAVEEWRRLRDADQPRAAPTSPVGADRRAAPGRQPPAGARGSADRRTPPRRAPTSARRLDEAAARRAASAVATTRPIDPPHGRPCAAVERLDPRATRGETSPRRDRRDPAPRDAPGDHARPPTHAHCKLAPPRFRPIVPARSPAGAA